MAYERNESRGGRPMRRGRRKVCRFCVDRVKSIDHKDIGRLRNYTRERAKIIPRRVTRTCATHQRALTIPPQPAPHLALLPYVSH